MKSSNEPISVYAAGSLRNALPALADAFGAATDNRIEARYGPAGLLFKSDNGAKGDRPIAHSCPCYGNVLRSSKLIQRQS